MSGSPEDAARIRRKFRWVLGVFIAGLVISGVTAFPLLTELNFIVRTLGLEARAATTHNSAGGLAWWIVHVRDGLRATYASHPFIAYGTDWLAFGHLVIALFFVGPMIDPIRNVFVLRAGMVACALVLPLALICGPLRGIPFYWRLVDCSFGVFGLPFLWYCLRLVQRLARAERREQEFTTRSDCR